MKITLRCYHGVHNQEMNTSSLKHGERGDHYFLDDNDRSEMGSPALINDGEDSTNSCCGWHPTTDKLLVIGHRDGCICSIDMRVDSLRSTYLQQKQFLGQVTATKWNCDGTAILTISTDGMKTWIRCFDFRYFSGKNSNRPLWAVQQDGTLKDLDWCPSRRNRFVTVGTAPNGDELRLHDSNTGNVITSVNTQSETTNVVFSPNGPELCTSHGKHNHDAACDNSLQLWKYDENSLTPSKGIRTCKDDPIVNMELNPKRSTDVVTMAADGTVRIYDVFQQKCVLPFTSEKARSKVAILSCAMNPSHMWDLGIPDLSGITGLNMR